MANRTLRVLNVEDSERDVTLLRRHLSRAGYDLVSERVDLPETMTASLEAHEWDVILCDYSMPHFNALSALAVLKKMELDIPFIIISGTIGEEIAVEAMRAGAHDYLMKDNLTRLAPTIERELQEAENRRARRRAEAELRKSEARYRRLIDTAYEGIWIADSNTHITYANKRLAEMLGYTVEEMIGRSAFEVFDDDAHGEMKATWKRILQGLEEQYDLRLRRKDGSALWVILSATPIQNELGQVIGSLAMLTDITKRKRAEQLVRLQATALESADNAILISGPEGTISWVNPAFTTLTGYAPEEVLGQTPRILKSGQHEPAFYEVMWKTLLSGQVWRGELFNLRKDGSAYVEEQTITPVLNENGEVTNFIAIKEDITQRKQSEEDNAQLTAQIESHRRRLDNIVASVPGVVWEAWGEPDAATQRIDFVSDYVETLLGYSVEEWLQTPNFWLSIVHPDDQAQTARDASADFAGGKNSNTREFRWIAKDGRVLWVQSSSAVITDGEGKPVGLRGVTIDITEAKRAEEAVKQAEEKFRSIFENAVEGIFQSTTEGRFISVNPAMVRILGYESPEELMAHRTDIRTQHYVDANTYEDLERLLAEHGFVVGYECEIYRKDRRRIWTMENVRVIRDKSGAILYYEGSIEDIDERKKLEGQFRQSQKLEAIGMLAGGIAHDFNNLLTVIVGYSDLTLLRLREEDPLRRNISEVKKAAERAAGLTRQLLAFSRKQVLQPKVLDLNEVVSELEKMLRRLIGEDVELRTALEPDLGSVKADPGQIEQLIMNLAVNARDAMPQGGKLTIETANVYLDEDYAKGHIAVIPGPCVMVAVSDTGTGMDRETQARIFEPFFTTKDAGKGTGLGLSTAYGIVKQSGGNILVYSEVGRGTSFKIYLPRVDEGAQEYKHGAETIGAIHGAETILLAEDEEMVRKLARQVLELYGYQVLEAANGGAALLICERHLEPIHLLITDVIMPEMSGRLLADRLGELRPEMKVLYMSGYTDNAIVHQGVLDKGANFIQKPFATEALVRTVRDVLDAPEKS